ncbi:MAG: DUF739 family protein [Lachnospiraceae bacterium]|nr:DUF739 family protein [Lachnospiraceae bacterium]
MQYAYKKLKGRIKEVFGTQAAFAESVGLSKNSVSKKLTGKTEFTQSDIEKWAKLLNIERKDFGEFFFM